MGRIHLPLDQPHGTRRRFGSKLHLLSLIGLIFLVSHFWYIPRQRWEARAVFEQQLADEVAALDLQLNQCHELQRTPAQYDLPPKSGRSNPRFNAETGQRGTIILRNATLFDGESTLKHAMDIHFSKGVITGIYRTSDHQEQGSGAIIIDVDGRFVTPGIVDMHSHHVGTPHPSLSVTDDLNEVNPDSGPLTPWARALDALKPYDEGARIVASGGITSSLILPGSANIIGGEAVPIKNVLLSGEAGEQVVEELLLEHGIPNSERRRYIKIACGENPAGLYDHTRMGTAWLFRKELERAEILRNKQDNWCAAAAMAKNRQDYAAIQDLMKDGGFPQSRALALLTGVLRGSVGVNIHCYEPEDMEAMIRHSKEFGFQIQAFHHALEAWRVPEMLKQFEENITIATFSHFSHYKHEAWDSSLYAGKILAEHNVSVAYKTDGAAQELKAKYLIAQAAEGHAFGLPSENALRAVTSIPAKSLGLDHRVGYARTGYDADIVVWDSHPLVNGATPLQVFIDGVSTLDDELLQDPRIVSGQGTDQSPVAPQMRPRPAKPAVQKTCTNAKASRKIVVTGIQNVLVPSLKHASFTTSNLTLVLDEGEIACLDSADNCASVAADGTHIELQNGHVLPGLTGIVKTMGLADITFMGETGDGEVTHKPINLAAPSVVYAKNGLRIAGKDLDRARLGGVTRAVVAPIISQEGGIFLQGVSTAFKTSGEQTILDGAIVKDDVGVHFNIGQSGKTTSTPTISTAIGQLRDILSQRDNDTVFSRVANGSLPLIAHVLNHHDMLHLIKMKRDFPSIDLIFYGASEAPLVAEQIAEADIPVIFTSLYSMPDSWETKDVLVGPPLTVSPVKVLHDAGVRFALAQHHFSDSEVHLLGIDAGFARKTAGLTEQEAVDLVSRNVNEILHLGDVSGSARKVSGDYVIYEGNPLEWGASVVLTVDGETGKVVECWPDST